MAGDSFRLEFEGLAEAEQELARLHARFGDLTPLMDIIGMTLEVDAEDNFTGEHSPAGVPWPKSRRAQESGGKTLQDSRRLFGSIGHKAAPTQVEVGTNVIYARRHNQGGSGTEQVKSHKRVMRMAFGVRLAEPRDVTVKAFSRASTTPKREFLGMSAGARADIASDVATYAGVEP